LAELEADGKVTLDVDGTSVELDGEDLQVRMQAKEGWAAAQGHECVVVLATELTDELIREGLARDLSRLINDRRKELDCQFTDRIRVGIVTDSDQLKQAVAENTEFIQGETLAVEIVFDSLPEVEGVPREVGGDALTLSVAVVADA